MAATEDHTLSNCGTDDVAYTLKNSGAYTTHSQPHEPYEEFYRVSQFVNGLVLYPSICVPGLLGNILTLSVLSRRSMRTSTNAFLGALAVSDAIKLTNDILYFMVILLLKTDPHTANKAYVYLYPYAHFIFNLSACVSSWLTVSVAVERYIMVCHPTRARNVCSRSRAISISVLVFIVMTGVALPSAFRYTTVTVVGPQSNETMLDINVTALWRNQTFEESYTWLQNLLRCIIPLCVLIVMNACIINALRKTRAKKKMASRNRVTFMMIMVILVFLVCITPDAIMSSFLGFGYHEESLLVKGIREFTDMLLALNAAVNIIIYCLFNKMFRSTFVTMCCGKRYKVASTNTVMDESHYRRLSEPNATVLNKSSLLNSEL